MNVAAGPRLAAAVTNAGGIGVIGGLRQTPKVLQESIDEIRANLEDKNAPIGVDLLIPQVGGQARKTNVRKVLAIGLTFRSRESSTTTRRGSSQSLPMFSSRTRSLFLCVR